ncbi:hypothetical protein BCR34DRAFT_580180 [Clohesyomyces aquaticus]|uniref:Uncharacterized protein n=1 Tax=Clohesyomyces aquaticus TaxID=1231657 RepID=A0A1Y1Y7V4_9PLEO|nr:hypothetical protein BCR34DRAFT_580180 [Clohesyomyces aquaticus]
MDLPTSWRAAWTRSKTTLETMSRKSFAPAGLKSFVLESLKSFAPVGLKNFAPVGLKSSQAARSRPMIDPKVALTTKVVMVSRWGMHFPIS